MKEFRGVKKILVLKLRYVGDALVLIPAARALRERFPESHITALVSPGGDEVLAGNPLFDDLLVFDPSIKGLSIVERVKKEFEFARSLRKKGFDMTVDLNGGDRTAIFSYLSKARYRLGYDMKGKGFAGKRRLYTHLGGKPDLKEHVILRDLNLLRRFGIDTPDLSTDVYASGEDDVFVERLLADNGIAPTDPFIHVHPSSRLQGKCWTAHGMACVLDGLSEQGFKIVITSGTTAKELSRVEDIKGLMLSKPIDLTGRVRLKHLASISRRATLFFGVDSAPMHIAAAVGTKVIALFGPSGAFNWGPWDSFEAHRPYDAGAAPYAGRNGVQSFGPHTVIQKQWSCAPCGKDGCDNSGQSDCLASITGEYVKMIVEAKLASCSRMQVRS